MEVEMMNLYSFHQYFQKHINIQVFKYRFPIITLLCLLMSISNVSGTVFSHDSNVPYVANDCSEYFQRQIVNDSEKWSGLIEFGVSRKQMWGFDITVVFLFDDKTFKIYGRPIINFELQKSYYHVMEDILYGRRLSINVTFPVKFKNLILKIVSIELDYQVICEDKNANTKRNGEMFSFDFKFKAPSDIIRKISQEIEYKGKGLRSNYCGISNKSVLNQTKSTLDEDRLESKLWPWVASLYVGDKYRCTVNMLSRSEAVTASDCFDSTLKHQKHDLLRIETFNNKNYRVRDYMSHKWKISDSESNYVTIIFLENPITDPSFVPACLFTRGSRSNNDFSMKYISGSIIGFEKKFHEDYVVLNRVNITTMTVKDCIDIKNGSMLQSNDERLCGISKNGLTWLEIDGLDGAGFYVEDTGQWYLRGIIQECLKINDTSDCDFDSPIIIVDIQESVEWLLNLTMYHPLGLERHDIVIHATTNSINILVIVLILIITFICLVLMWGLWYTCRKRNRPIVSEVPTLINTNDGIQLLKRENKRFSYIN